MAIVIPRFIYTYDAFLTCNFNVIFEIQLSECNCTSCVLLYLFQGSIYNYPSTLRS